MDTLTVSVRRIRWLFREFPRVVVSVSSGKDSTVLYHLALTEAERAGRKVEVFFLDQEAEYQSSIDIISQWMRHPLVIPKWYQVPLLLTNATSHRDVFLRAWWPGEKWIRDKDPIAISEIDGHYPNRFYDFFPWIEAQASEKTAFLVGIRMWESLNRQRATKIHAGYENYGWSTKTKNPLSFRFYPIYHWQPRYIWKYIADSGVPYNNVYNKMYMKSGVDLCKMRVSNLVHEQAYRSLLSLQEYEPETYERLITRLGGVHAAALYANEQGIYKADKLPTAHPSWLSYRDYLLETTPSEYKERFSKRFSRQHTDEATCKQQVKQLLSNDWEGNLPILRPKAERLRETWWNRL